MPSDCGGPCTCPGDADYCDFEKLQREVREEKLKEEVGRLRQDARLDYKIQKAKEEKRQGSDIDGLVEYLVNKKLADFKAGMIKLLNDL